MASDTETKTPEALLAEQAGIVDAPSEVANLSTEDIAELEELNAATDDSYSEADAREARIELNNDATDELVNEAQEVSREGIDEGHDRG